MKKFIFYTTLFFALTSVSNAQMTKGMVLTGIDLSTVTYQSESSSANDFENTNLQFVPSVGFFIKNNELIGFSVSYGQASNEYVTSKTKSDYYGAAVYYCRYIPLGKKFFLFGQARAGYTVMEKEETFETGRTNTRENTLSLSLSPGIAYSITKRFQLETGIGSMLGVAYQRDKSNNTYPTSQYEYKRSGISFYANANPRSELYIGFRLALGK